ncbi:hypothetical protein ACFU44_04890 [Nocardia rhizosphaerihabitans]
MADDTPAVPSVHFFDLEMIEVELRKRRIDRLLRVPPPTDHVV